MEKNIEIATWRYVQVCEVTACCHDSVQMQVLVGDVAKSDLSRVEATSHTNGYTNSNE